MEPDQSRIQLSRGESGVSQFGEVVGGFEDSGKAMVRAFVGSAALRQLLASEPEQPDVH